ncbi:MAG: DUF4105 domain-containing protein [Gammaproteobacteria bacterium]|nr:DUF4105 domain-containing protein [Gammaproteobacteria bacterium]
MGLLTLAVFLQISPAQAGTPSDRDYLIELLRQSRIARLADEPLWHRLVHYRPRMTGGFLSEVVDPRFFLAATGQTDPQAELEATLSAFFSEQPREPSGQPAQCAFIARYRWLRSVLAIDPQRLVPATCDRFQRWWSALNPASLTLIFASAYMDNPASMFGHTLLRIDQRQQTEQTRLLAYTVNYAAHDTSTNPLDYAVSGLTGGFRGYLDIKPYYELVKEYGDIENRDLWEYRLNLNDRQIERLVMHVWELQGIYFDYFFFKENCAYRLLTLLEVADPSLRLSEQFSVWAIPPDTVRLLTEQTGLVDTVTPRPARSTVLQRRMNTLSGAERERLAALVDPEVATPAGGLAGLSPPSQARVLDAAIDYLAYRQAGEESVAADERQHLHHLLTLRSRLPVDSDLPMTVPYATQPELGHGSARAGLGWGWRSGEAFLEMDTRAAYHDLLDPDPGYTPGAQIEVLDLAVRYYPKPESLRLQRLTLLDMVSLTTAEGLLRVPSWRLRAGWERTTQPGCDDCLSFTLNGGLGSAWGWESPRQAVVFAFPEIDADFGRAFSDSFRLGAGVTLGAEAQLTDAWKCLVSGSYWRYPWGDAGDDWRWFIGQSYALDRNWVLRLEIDRRKRDNWTLLNLQHYF